MGRPLRLLLLLAAGCWLLAAAAAARGRPSERVRRSGGQSGSARPFNCRLVVLWSLV